jgi:hypothetical protein
MNEEPDDTADCEIIHMELQDALRSELQRTIVSIERAIELSYDDKIDAGLDRLLEAARATLDLMKEPAL